MKQIAEGFQRAVRIMGQNPFGKDFAQLYAFLVETVQIPQETLVHDLVLEMGKQRAKRFRCQFAADDYTSRTIAGKMLVPVPVLFAACKCDHLSGDVGT